MKKILGFTCIVLFLSSLALSCGTSGGSTTVKAGTYSATARGMHGPLSVEVNLSTNAITSVKVTSHRETPGLGDWPVILMPEKIVQNNSLAVDAVNGATITSFAILAAVEDCLNQAGANIAAFNKPPRVTRARNETITADVIIVGGGGAGFAAAVSAVNAGASVFMVEKAGFVGGNSVVSGGIYNSADPVFQDYAYQKERSPSLETIVTDALNERPVNEEHRSLIDAVRREYEAYLRTDKTLFDSPNWHALQTWNGGDKVANLSIIKLMTSLAPEGFEWVKSLGAEFLPVVYLGAGSLYPRTHSAHVPNGTPYIAAFSNYLEKNSSKFKCVVDTAATGLIMENGKVVGVNAEGKDGQKLTLRANKGVVLATGGFAGNVELRQEYCQGEKWPDLGPALPTTNLKNVTGDGIFFARDAGAQLIDMEQIQLLPYCNPTTGGTYDVHGISLTAIFVNKQGRRFVREDGRRDDMSKAIIDQTDSVMYMVLGSEYIPDPDKIYTNGGQSITYMIESNSSGYVTAPTIEELAAKINVPPAVLRKTVDDFNTALESGRADEFGRRAFGLPIKQAPFYAYPRAAATHHTMGGVRFDEYTRALKADGTPVPGLYCAGEITGGIHGGNRLGGNAIVDFTVFGRIAGISAAAGR